MFWQQRAQPHSEQHAGERNSKKDNADNRWIHATEDRMRGALRLVSVDFSRFTADETVSLLFWGGAHFRRAARFSTLMFPRVRAIVPNSALLPRFCGRRSCCALREPP